MSNPLRPSLPSMLSNDTQPSNTNSHTPPTSSGQFGSQDGKSQSPGQSIRLPPISFLSNMSNMSNAHQMAPPSSLGVPRLLNNIEAPGSNTSQQSTTNSGSTPQFSPHVSNTPKAEPPNLSPSISSINHLTHQHPQQTQPPPPQQQYQVPQQPQAHQHQQFSPQTNAYQQPSPAAAGSISSQTTEPAAPSISQKPSFLSNIVSSKSNEQITPHAQTQVKLKEEITKPDITEESDEDIIKYYEKKFGIDDFTNEEKHDILQHEKRARIEKAKNPNYKTYLCYSIIKRLNTIQPAKKTSPAAPASKEDTASTRPAEETEVENKKEFVKRKIIINNDDVLNYASKFPRKHLGSVLYTPYPTISTHRQLSVFQPSEFSTPEPHQGTEIVPLLPKLTEHINSIVTVRIPSYQINDLQNNKNYQNRSIWGTDVYTDDSDVLLILKHNGFLPAGETEVETLVESPLNRAVEKRTPGNKTSPQNIDQTVNNFRHFINIIGGDINVDLIVLPPLVKYEGIYRNGVKSREWKTGHDGVSIAIHGVRYGEINSAVENINDVDVRKRKIDQVNEMREKPMEILNDDGKWKLNIDAYKKIKLQLELEKTKKLEKEEKKKAKENSSEATKKEENVSNE